MSPDAFGRQLATRLRESRSGFPAPVPVRRGTRYRATVMGPGVTPDAFWEARAPRDYSRQVDLAADTDLLSLLAGDPVCRPR